MGVIPKNVETIDQIPCLPISFFKTHTIKAFSDTEECIFYSSTTSGQTPSRHFVKDLSLYRESYRRGFRFFYGDPKDYIIIAFLPSYLERQGSSLIEMVNDLIQLTESPYSRFYKTITTSDLTRISETRSSNQTILLLGVTYALLDFCSTFSGLNIQNLLVMETGGMKGRRQEMTREEVHSILGKKLGVPNIHSEYGMTELLSQAYSKGHGRFLCPPWMKVLGRDIYDPKQQLVNTNAALNMIDLANINSCSFIATDDVGLVYEDGSFEVKGRLDMSDIRGCNLMLS